MSTMADYDMYSSLLGFSLSAHVIIGLKFTTIVLLSLYLLVFTLVPSKDRTLLHCNMASFCLSLLIFYGLCIYMLELESFDYSNRPLVGPIIVFSALAALMWMLTMSFDVWRSMRAAVKRLRPETSKKERLRFIVYALFSWSLPFYVSLLLDSKKEICPNRFFDNKEQCKNAIMSIPVVAAVSCIVCSCLFLLYTLLLILKLRYRTRSPSNSILLEDFENIDEPVLQNSSASVEEIKRHIRTFAILIPQMGLILLLVVVLIVLSFLNPLERRISVLKFIFILGICQSSLILTCFTCKEENRASVVSRFSSRGNYSSSVC